MKCTDCKHFKILCEPIHARGAGYWDFGQAKCMKYNLVIDFLDRRKLRSLECVCEPDEETKPRWIEADKHPSSISFICPHCREKVYFSHGSSGKSRKNGVDKRCLYRFCPWCGVEVEPLRVTLKA